jgi:hypothetical protein
MEGRDAGGLMLGLWMNGLSWEPVIRENPRTIWDIAPIFWTAVPKRRE